MPVDPTLAKAVAEGTYVIDPRAVAEAIVRREARRSEALRISEVLEAVERDTLACGVDEVEPRPGTDLA